MISQNALFDQASHSSSGVNSATRPQAVIRMLRRAGLLRRQA
jgi:hypothetical protein